MSRNGIRASGPWVIDTRDFGRRPGSSRDYRRTASFNGELGVPGVVTVATDTPVELDVVAESVVEGVLISGDVTTEYNAECARCLEEVTSDVSIRLLELFAYPDSTTEATTDDDEIFRLNDDLIDLEPITRDAVVLALPHAPLCSADCQGLCAECGGKWADLGSNHAHEMIDPRWAALRERFGDLAPGNSADTERPGAPDQD